jgi:hypothetical protein
MIYGENHMVVGNGQQPFLLRFEPLRLLESPTRGAVSIFSGFVMPFPALANRTFL